MVFKGEYKAKISSDYKYYRGSIVEIECIRDDIFKKIVDAVYPILAEEKELIKKEVENKENES